MNVREQMNNIYEQPEQQLPQPVVQHRNQQKKTEYKRVNA